MFRSAHIWSKRLFTSLALLLRLSFLDVIKDIDIWLSFFNGSGNLASCSLVLQWRIIWSRIKSRTVGFTWSCMNLTFDKLKGRTLARHLRLSFLVNKKPFNFFTMLCLRMNTVSCEFFDRDGEVTLSFYKYCFYCYHCFHYYYWYYIY